ncbi:hypothetical protein RND81_10G071200 [Saponaria officinalis]|uniref:Uncharacterized protein n=1 Tax=Saponaria officinalis TaxID=3572 RepID=A0AAW1I1S1_SAPOF
MKRTVTYLLKSLICDLSLAPLLPCTQISTNQCQNAKPRVNHRNLLKIHSILTSDSCIQS